MNKIIKKCLSAMSGLLLLGSSFAHGYDCYSMTCFDPCACSQQFWADADYLFWQIKNSPASPVLVSEGPTENDVTPVIGGGSVKNDWRSGGKFALGYWFDETRHFGAEANYFFIPKHSKSKTVGTDGSVGTNYLISTYQNVLTNTGTFAYVSAPGFFAGTATRKIDNWMQGAELNGLAVFPCDCNFSFSALVGFRYWNFNDTLKMSINSPAIDSPTDIWQATDRFHVQNNFYGGQIGCGVEYGYDCFSMNAKVKVALGAMYEELNIQGHFLTNSYDDLGTPQEFVGGYYTFPTNIGRHKQTKFAVIPEVSINFAYRFTDCVHVKVGYTFLYASNMIWAANQIDLDVNPTQSVLLSNNPDAVLVGEAAPRASIKTSSFWAQGVNAGVEFLF